MKKKGVKLKTKTAAKRKKTAGRAGGAFGELRAKTAGAAAAVRERVKRLSSPAHLGFGDRVSALLFPPRCMFCDEILEPGARCEACGKRLAPLRLQGDARFKRGMEDKKLDGLDEAAACYVYAQDVAEAVIRYKFCGETGYFREMAACMAQTLAQAVDTKRIGLVVQVPAFRADDTHSRLLAKRVAALIGAKFDPAALVKIAPTRKQHELGRAERELNIRNAFDVPDRKRVEGKTVLICDDVVTSGCTLSECARTLREAGAASVVAAVFASTRMGDTRP
ncbi:MAG: phosphoribosyltransferase family protein [Oscillospiraceae bacterium]|nr:phosphoribosyltransferase family protein [Oscillospiraceae bacterium]